MGTRELEARDFMEFYGRRVLGKQKIVIQKRGPILALCAANEPRVAHEPQRVRVSRNKPKRGPMPSICPPDNANDLNINIIMPWFKATCGKLKMSPADQRRILKMMGKSAEGALQR